MLDEETWMQKRSLVFVALAGATLAGCTINPVTGERELALVRRWTRSRSAKRNTFLPRWAVITCASPSSRATSMMPASGSPQSHRALPYEFVAQHPCRTRRYGRKIAVNRGLLLELGSEAELAAVLGHEIVHAAARHGAQAMQRGMLLQGAVLAATAATRKSDYSNLAVGAAGLGAQLINQRYGREAELESDRYGMQYMARAGYDPAAAISLQETFVRLSEDRDEGWLAGLFASHPPSAERVAQNRATAATIPAGGDLGRERYSAAIAGLVRTRGAYESYDRGREALAEGNLTDAESRAREAVRLVADEAQFHALLGDIDYQQNRFADAVNHYRDAITNNDRFFYFPLRKGLAHIRLMQWDEAETNLESSVAMLPTADAYYGLGMIAERRGDYAGALANYREAAASSGAAGQAAQDAIVRLDLPANPGQYLAVRTGLDSSGRLIVELANPTRLPVADIGLVVRYVDTQGALRQLARVVPGPLPAGGAQRLATGLGPFTSPDSYEVTINAARVVTQ
jgi:tetratricopeptide (TPR) repeat protein